MRMALQCLLDGLLVRISRDTENLVVVLLPTLLEELLSFRQTTVYLAIRSVRHQGVREVLHLCCRVRSPQRLAQGHERPLPTLP